jgi:hypothetical protein
LAAHDCVEANPNPKSHRLRACASFQGEGSMVTFVAGAGDGFLPYRFTRHMFFIEAAGQTFKPGAVVVLDAAGRIIKGGTDPAAATVVGVASERATGVLGSKVGVYVADENAEFKGRVQDTGVLALTNVGKQYSIVLDATNDIFRVDLSDTTNKNVTVTELIDAVGDVNGRVAFKWANAARGVQYS